MPRDSYQNPNVFVVKPFSPKERKDHKQKLDQTSRDNNHSPLLRDGYSLKGIQALVAKTPHNTWSDAVFAAIPSGQWARSMRPKVKNGELSPSRRSQIINSQERGRYLNTHLAAQDRFRRTKDRWFSLWDKSVHNHDAWGLD